MLDCMCATIDCINKDYIKRAFGTLQFAHILKVFFFEIETQSVVQRVVSEKNVQIS